MEDPNMVNTTASEPAGAALGETGTGTQSSPLPQPPPSTPETENLAAPPPEQPGKDAPAPQPTAQPSAPSYYQLRVEFGGLLHEALKEYGALEESAKKEFMLAVARAESLSGSSHTKILSMFRRYDEIKHILETDD